MSIKFKEVITKENIEDFSKDYIAEIKIKENYFYVRFFSDHMGPSPEFHVSDYSFVGINSCSNLNLSEKWRMFMLHKLKPKDRDIYITYYNNYLDSLKTSYENCDID